MKILLAPNSMKGSLNAFDFADQVEKAFRSVSDTFCIRKIPVADGGDYTGEVLSRALKAEKVSIQVEGPCGSKVTAGISVSGKTAIIEMADASGMKLLQPDELNPLETSSFGTGQLIQKAIDLGCSEIWLAIGGSATVDGGMGMAEALGFRFFDQKNQLLKGNGKNLEKISEIVIPENLPECSFKIICDVDNVLLGEMGAARVFGPQKGATPEMVEILENGLKNIAQIISEKTGKNISDNEGTGAAGGIAVPLLAFFNAEIVPGASFVLSALDFEKNVKWADVVITGEGKFDEQTLHKKAPFEVARLAKNCGKTVYAITGQTELNKHELFDGIYSISDTSVNVEWAMQNAASLLFSFARKFAESVILKENLQ